MQLDLLQEFKKNAKKAPSLYSKDVFCMVEGVLLLESPLSFEKKSSAKRVNYVKNETIDKYLCNLQKQGTKVHLVSRQHNEEIMDELILNNISKSLLYEDDNENIKNIWHTSILSLNAIGLLIKNSIRSGNLNLNSINEWDVNDKNIADYIIEKSKDLSINNVYKFPTLNRTSNTL